jgi:hypothetical protein
MSKHEAALQYVVETLSKKEPVMSSVLAWGWLLKQVRNSC